MTFAVDCCLILLCVNKSSDPAAMSMNIQSSDGKGTLISGLNVIANNKYIQGNSDPFLWSDTRKAQMSTPVATILRNVKYPYGRYGRRS